LPARLPVRVDRDLPARAADLRADPGEVRFLRPHRQQHRPDDMVRHAGGGQSADRVHDAAVRSDAVLYERDRPAGGDHDRRVPRHVSLRRSPGAWASAVHLLPGHQSLAASAGRVRRVATKSALALRLARAQPQARVRTLGPSPSHISFSALRLAWPSLPTMRWSCTAIPSGRATSTIARLLSISAREGVGSPEGWLCTRMTAAA